MKPQVYFTTVALLLLLAGCISMRRGPQNAYNHIVKHDVTFDAIIVPGIPYNGEIWDSVMKARVIWAYVLYKNGVTRNIIFSGDAVYSPYYESKVMGLYAQALGVPQKNIYYDTQARHSTENVYYSYLIAKQNGFKVVALTTDPIQSALLRSFTIRRFGTPVYHMPFVMDSIRKYNHMVPAIDPAPAMKDNFNSITSEESTVRRFFGTLGRDIEWKEHKNGVLPPL